MVEFIRRLQNVQQVDILPFHKIAMYLYIAIGKKYQIQNLVEPDQEHVQNLKEHFHKIGRRM